MAINREEKCNNSFGGISEVYVMKYKDYSRSQIKVVDNELVTFPFSVIYDLNALQSNFTENIDIEDGGVSYSQSGGFQLNKILKEDNYKILASIDWRIIIKDNNNNYRLIGLETGLKIKFTKETGSNLNEFNGFKFNFETKEENTAPFLDDLNGFSINGINGLQQELQYEL